MLSRFVSDVLAMHGSFLNVFDITLEQLWDV